ncbi:MAG: glycosyltransferase, partial [Candidatus Omnitrophica bacterium]|nr:glycosyltransferase [Candidatus Omnitrophota bacterium]
MMGRKRILYVIWSLDLGGAEQVVIHLASNLDPKKFEPMVCCLNTKGRYAASVEQKGIRVFELKKRPKLDLFLIPKLVRLIREEKIDLIHTHLFTANFWGRLVAFFSGVPVVSTEHNMDVWKKWFHFAIDRILARVNTRMIFVSESVMKFYEKRVSRFNGKAKVIYNGIDVERFQNSPHPTLSPSGGEEKGEGAPHVIGIVGRLVPQKGHLDFIEAIRILRLRKKNVVGLIVGDGPFKE